MDKIKNNIQIEVNRKKLLSISRLEIVLMLEVQILQNKLVLVRKLFMKQIKDQKLQ